MKNLTIHFQPERREHMAPATSPLLECTNCRAPIWLPHPSPQGKLLGQLEWPNPAWNRIFGCLKCGHVSLYTAQAVKWASSGSVTQRQLTVDGTAPQLWVLYEEAKCGTGMHVTQVRIHSSWYALPTPSEVARIEATWKQPLEERYGAPIVYSGFRDDPDWWT
jgi:hypothetical protein